MCADESVELVVLIWVGVACVWGSVEACLWIVSLLAW